MKDEVICIYCGEPIRIFDCDEKTDPFIVQMCYIADSGRPVKVTNGPWSGWIHRRCVYGYKKQLEEEWKGGD